MRHISTLILALFVRSAGLSQPVPDTTDWHAYFPLQVGNEWQYNVSFDDGTEWHDGFRIEGDTLLENDAFFVVHECRRFDGDDPLCGLVHHLRYDEVAALILARIEVGGQPQYEWWQTVPCQLDIDLNVGPVDCTLPGSGEYFTGGGIISEYIIPPDTLRDVTLKEFGSNFPPFLTWMINGIGKVYRSGSKSSSRTENLIFARINKEEFGARAFAIPTEIAPFPTAPDDWKGILVLFPNPAYDHITVVAGIDEFSDISIQILDVRGRELVRHETRASGVGLTEITIDLLDLPSGLYVVRLRTQDGLSSTRSFAHIR